MGDKMTNLKSFINKLSDTAVQIMDENLSVADIPGTIDTGSMSFNIVASASLTGGFQDNRITMLAGEPGTGKTFVTLSVCKTFQQRYPDGIIAYFDTEYAIEQPTLVSAGLDVKRVLLFRPNYIEQFRAQAVKLLTEYAEWEDRPRMLMVLDSMGGLTTKKAWEEGHTEDLAADMGRRSQAIGQAFTLINGHLGKLKTAMIVNNHLYANVSGYGPSHKQGGGLKAQHYASSIFHLTKKRFGDKGDQSGNIVTIEVVKSRFTKPGKVVETMIHFDRGLDRYYGLVPIAVKAGIFEKGPRHLLLPDGRKVFESVVVKNPDEYFTAEVLARLEKAVYEEYHLGGKGDGDDIGLGEE